MDDHQQRELGEWEKHTKGIGLKLLNKFGFKGRLGANEDGVSSSIEVKVRPNAMGLGFGDFKEASAMKSNKILEAEWRKDPSLAPSEEEVVEEESIDIEADVQALFEGEELSEEFQSKARTIFEAAIKEKVSEIKENLQTAYEQALVEEVASVRDELTERVDAYLEYVADEWIQENQLQVESGLKTEMTESFLEGMKSLFEEHYVSVPEDKYDVLESMVDKLDEMESKLNEQIERNVALNQRLAESNSDVILADVSEGLALSQKEKLASLASNVEFESETDYREKLGTLKESYFPSKTSAPKSTSENLSEEVSTDEVISEEVAPRMQAYLDVLSRTAKK